MRFTENEMTTAIKAVSKKRLFANATHTAPGSTEGLSADEVWDRATGHERYVMLDFVGEIVLGALVSLPDVDVAIGERATFTDEQVATAVEPHAKRRVAQQVLDSRMVADEQVEECWEATPPAVRSSVLASAERHVREVIEAMPVRSDPDALVVPDHL